jgi:hypothetical protein
VAERERQADGGQRPDALQADHPGPA